MTGINGNIASAHNNELCPAAQCCLTFSQLGHYNLKQCKPTDFVRIDHHHESTTIYLRFLRKHDEVVRRDL